MLGLVILITALAAPPAPAADVVFLRSGERVVGRVFEEGPAVGVRILLEDGTIRHVPPAEVAHVEWAGAPTPPPLLPRAPWYLRLALGVAGADLHVGGGTMGFAPPNANVPIPMACVAGAGMAIGEHLAVGGEWSVGYSMHAPNEDLPDLYDRDLVLQHLGVVATVYPFKQRLERRPDVALAPHGPFLRAGLGAAFLRSSPDDSGPSGTWSERGVGVTAGVGWAVLLGGRLTFDVGLDLAWDRFQGAAPSAPDRAFSYLFTFGASRY